MLRECRASESDGFGFSSESSEEGFGFSDNENVVTQESRQPSSSSGGAVEPNLGSSEGNVGGPSTAEPLPQPGSCAVPSGSQNKTDERVEFRPFRNRYIPPTLNQASQSCLHWVRMLVDFWFEFMGPASRQFMTLVGVESGCTGLCSEAWAILVALSYNRGLSFIRGYLSFEGKSTSGPLD